MDLSKLKKVATAARELNTTRATIYSWVAKGELTGNKIDGNLFIAVDEKYNQLREKDHEKNK